MEVVLEGIDLEVFVKANLGLEDLMEFDRLEVLIVLNQASYNPNSRVMAYQHCLVSI